MLTPIEIQGKTFKNSGMGYSKADVDSFFSSVSADFEALYKENLSLKEKINNLDASLSHYKEIEKSLQKALVLAETTAEETIVGAKKNATVIEQEAVLKAQSIVADAKVELEQLHVKTTDLLQQYDRYRTQYKALASAQLDLLNSEADNKTQKKKIISEEKVFVIFSLCPGGCRKSSCRGSFVTDSIRK